MGEIGAVLPAEVDGELVRQEVRETAALVQFAVTTAAEHVATAANHTPTAVINLHNASKELLDAKRCGCIHVPFVGRCEHSAPPGKELISRAANCGAAGVWRQVAAVAHRRGAHHVHRVQPGIMPHVRERPWLAPAGLHAGGVRAGADDDAVVPHGRAVCAGRGARGLLRRARSTHGASAHPSLRCCSHAWLAFSATVMAFAKALKSSISTE
jgi:hypothetical protein